VLFSPTKYSWDDISDHNKTLHNPFVTDFYKLMSVAFVDSWEAQLDYYKQQAIDVALAKEVREMLDGEATQAAAAIMDVEPTADPALLRNIIKQQVDSETKKLHAELNKLKQLLARTGKQPPASPKNKPRGATAKTNPVGASSTKKKSILKKTGPTSTTSRKKPAATVAKPGKDSQSGKPAFKLTKKAPPEQGRSQPTRNSKKKQSKK